MEFFILKQFPIKDLSRSPDGIFLIRIKKIRVHFVLIQIPKMKAVMNAEGLDDFIILKPFAVRRCLIAVELDGINPRKPADIPDGAFFGIDKNPDGGDKRRQEFNNFTRAGGRDKPRALFIKNKSQCPRAAVDGLSGIVLISYSADFDSHHNQRAVSCVPRTAY